MHGNNVLMGIGLCKSIYVQNPVDSKPIKQNIIVVTSEPFFNRIFMPANNESHCYRESKYLFFIELKSLSPFNSFTCYAFFINKE